MQEEEVAFIFGVILMPLLLLCGVVVVLMAMWRRTKITEMAHRERMAMIERGLAPPPITGDPIGSGPFTYRRDVPSRRLSGGIVVIGFGLGLMVLIGFAAGAPAIGVGLGGAVAILGVAFVVTALVQGERSQSLPPQPAPVPRPAPQDRES
jgi:hypothetical protein